jgi:hypothetical protein
MSTLIKLRRDTAANWASADPVLQLGEPGYDTTNNELRIGDGTTPWSELTPIAGGGAANIGNWVFDGNDATVDNDGYPHLYGGPDGGPEFTYLEEAGNTGSYSQTMYINGEDGFFVSLDYGNAQFAFNTNGTTIFPTLEVDLHNGGVQTGQVLQFGDAGQQAIITGPTPAVDNNAQRLIIQGQRGNGTGEGGDVYLWAGDAENNGGDIKIYAGDADAGNVNDRGGYVNIDGGSGYTRGGQVEITGGYSSSGDGGYVNLIGGQGNIGGDANIQGGYGQAGPGGDVSIIGGASGNGQAEYGNVIVATGSKNWTFDNTGNLVLPSGTPSINYANGDPYGAGGGSGVSIVPNDVIYGSGSLYGNANPGFTVEITGDDDQAYDIPVDFPIEFLGNSYSSGNVWLVSNSYLTFGPNDYTEYHPVGPVVIPVPAIYIGATDLSNQKYYYGYADGTDVFVIGFEGSIETSGETGFPAIQWELQVNSATPDQIKIVVAGPANNGGALNFPAGVWGISNGDVWIDQYQPLPWYSNNNDDTYNAITIAPVTPVSATTIAFTGPGVTYSENGGTTYINIDPFDEAISVGYDSDSSEAIISSVYYGLTITTATDGEQLTLAPLGPVNISAGSASDNQPGSGYQVNITGGNAHDDPNTPGQNDNGGNVRIEGGSAVGNGTPGGVNIISNGNTWTFAPTGNLTLPSNTASINYANGDPYGGGGANTANIVFSDTVMYVAANTASQFLNIAYNGEGYSYLSLPSDATANTTNAILRNDSGNVLVGTGTNPGGNTYSWLFGNDGNLTLPSNTSSINYANGDPFSGGPVNTGNVTFDDNVVIGTGDQYGGNGLYLAPGTDSPGNLQYLRVRGGDYVTHIHLDTGNNVFFDQYFGDDNKYVKLEATGNIVISADDDVGNTAQWTFDVTGNLEIPANGYIETPVGSNGNINIHPDGNGIVTISGNTSGALLRVVGDEVNSFNRIEVDTFGNTDSLGGAFTGTFSRGTRATPEAVQNQDRLAIFTGKGYDGSVLSQPAAQITMGALGNWSPSNHGSFITFNTTLPNTTTQQEVVRIYATGDLHQVIGNIVVEDGVIKTNAFTVSSLPLAANAGIGSRSFVTDADTRTFGNTVVGGAGNAMPVWSDGTNWYIG